MNVVISVIILRKPFCEENLDNRRFESTHFGIISNLYSLKFFNTKQTFEQTVTGVVRII